MVSCSLFVLPITLLRFHVSIRKHDKYIRDCAFHTGGLDYNDPFPVEVHMEKMSRADMQIKVRTPIGLLLVLLFLGKWLLDTFEEGRVILETLPPVLAFLALPFPSFVLLLLGIALLLCDLKA